MLAAVRSFAKSPWAAGLLFLLIISFAVFGIQDVFTGRVSNWVVKAGPREISPTDFKAGFDRAKAGMESQARRPITLEEAVAQGLDLTVLNEMAANESTAEWMRRIGVRPSDKLVAAELRKIPAFFDKVTGAFDSATYQQLLGSNNMTPDRFEASIRDEIANAHLGSGVFGGFRAPRAYAALAAVYALEARDISYLTVTSQMVGPIPPPTDAQLTAFMNENKAQLMRPEFRVLSVVKFDPAASAPAAIDPAKIVERFNFKKDSLSSPELRTIAQIPVTAQQAAAVADRLRKGEDPAVVAKSIGKEALVITDKPKSALPDRKIADAAFALNAGEVSGAVAGDLGTAVVKVLKVTPAVVPTLDQHRAAIETELRNEVALEKIDQQTQAYEEAHNAGGNLLESAAKAGAVTFTVGPVTAQGQALPGAAVTGLTPKILETGFALPASGESDLTDAGEGAYFAVRVERVIPPAMPALAEIRSQLVPFYVQRKQAELMTQRAEALAERVRKGEALSAVAASAGAKVETAAGLDRMHAQERLSLGQDLLVKTFSAKQGEVFTAQTGQFGMAVAKLDSVKPGSLAQAPQMAGQVEQNDELLVRALNSELRRQAAVRLKAKTNPAGAKSALGLDPALDEAAKK